MILKEIEVKKSEGVSREDAQTIVQRSMRYSSSIIFEWKTCKVNAKSLMGVLSMGLKCGNKIMVIINGDDQEEAAKEVQHLFENNFKINW